MEILSSDGDRIELLAQVENPPSRHKEHEHIFVPWLSNQDWRFGSS